MSANGGAPTVSFAFFSPTFCQLVLSIRRLKTVFSILQQTMVYQAAMQEEKLRKGPWNEEEDELLVTFVTLLGERR